METKRLPLPQAKLTIAKAKSAAKAAVEMLFTGHPPSTSEENGLYNATEIVTPPMSGSIDEQAIALKTPESPGQ